MYSLWSCLAGDKGVCTRRRGACEMKLKTLNHSPQRRINSSKKVPSKDKTGNTMVPPNGTPNITEENLK